VGRRLRRFDSAGRSAGAAGVRLRPARDLVAARQGLPDRPLLLARNSLLSVPLHPVTTASNTSQQADFGSPITLRR
jgi:hypothetical protein